MNSHNKTKNNSYPILNDLLRDSRELEADHEKHENSINSSIALINARTKSENSARDSQYRSRIAIIFSISFVAILSIIIVLIPIYNATFGKESQIDQNGLLESFSSIFGTILGFVLGYYFKDKSSGDENGN